MPIPVVCSSCGAKLNAPDAATGKKVKCRNCQAVIAVPVPTVAEEGSDFEFVEPAKPTAAVPVEAEGKRSTVVDDDEEDDEAPRKYKKTARRGVEDEDEEDEPLRKSKKKAIVEDDDDRPKRRMAQKSAQKQKLNPVILLLGGIGALFAVCFLGIAIWYFAVREKSGTAGPAINPIAFTGQSPSVGVTVPAGWTKIDRKALTVYMQDSLGTPQELGDEAADITILNVHKKGQRGTNGLGASAVKVPAETYAPLTANPEAGFDKVEQQTAKTTKTTILGRNPTTLDGQTGREFKVQNGEGVGYLRVVFANGRVYTLRVQAATWAEADAMAQIYFGTAKIKS